MARPIRIRPQPVHDRPSRPALTTEPLICPAAISPATPASPKRAAETLYAFAASLSATSDLRTELTAAKPASTNNPIADNLLAISFSMFAFEAHAPFTLATCSATSRLAPVMPRPEPASPNHAAVRWSCVPFSSILMDLAIENPCNTAPAAEKDAAPPLMTAAEPLAKPESCAAVQPAARVAACVAGAVALPIARPAAVATLPAERPA
ncbi:hypothetical protein D9M68_720690 [compost metagenome]